MSIYNWAKEKEIIIWGNIFNRYSVVGWRAEGPSGFSTPRLGGVPSLTFLTFANYKILKRSTSIKRNYL